MARLRNPDGGYYEANIWPAVTDTILLMASIFIVLSVVSMVSLVRKYADYDIPGKENDRLQMVSYSIPSSMLFTTGHFELKDEKRCMAQVRSILTYMAEHDVQRFQKDAKERRWPDGYFIVIEAAGHTDDVALGSSLAHQGDGNWDLSAQRAARVVHVMEKALAQDRDLRKKLGIAELSHGEATPGSTVLRVSGYSSHLPSTRYSAPKLTLSKIRDRNRRVEIRIFAQESGQVTTVEK